MSGGNERGGGREKENGKQSMKSMKSKEKSGENGLFLFFAIGLKGRSAVAWKVDGCSSVGKYSPFYFQRIRPVVDMNDRAVRKYRSRGVTVQLCSAV